MAICTPFKRIFLFLFSLHRSLCSIRDLSRSTCIKRNTGLDEFDIFGNSIARYALNYTAGGSILEKGRPLPKFGEWDVNDPASADGFTVIFNKASNEKKKGGKPDSPPKDRSKYKHETALGKPQSKKWFCCMASGPAE